MKRYEYKFVKVSINWKAKRIFFHAPKNGSTFEACKEVIQNEAEAGWRFKQIIMPFNEGSIIGRAQCYQVIFEREIS